MLHYLFIPLSLHLSTILLPYLPISLPPYRLITSSLISLSPPLLSPYHLLSYLLITSSLISLSPPLLSPHHLLSYLLITLFILIAFASVPILCWRRCHHAAVLTTSTLVSGNASVPIAKSGKFRAIIVALNIMRATEPELRNPSDGTRATEPERQNPSDSDCLLLFRLYKFRCPNFRRHFYRLVIGMGKFLRCLQN